MDGSVRKRLLWGKAALQIPKALAGLLLWDMIGLLLPLLAAWVLAVVLVVGIVLSFAAPHLMVRLLWWAWRAAGGHGGAVLLSPIRRPGLSIAGPHHLVATRGVEQQLTPVALNYAGTLQALVAHRLDVLVALLALPWDIVAGLAGGVLRFFTELPLVGWAWQVRFVVGGIAAVQAWMAGWPGLAGVVVALIALSYVMPWWRNKWLAAAHRAAAQEHQQAVYAEVESSVRQELPEPVEVRPMPVPSGAGDRVRHPTDVRADSMHRRHRRIALHRS